MNALRLNGFFDWIRRHAVPVDGAVRDGDNVPGAHAAEVDEERDVAAPRVEPLPPMPIRWGNFR